ncbi:MULTISPECIES: caspase family protein [unclassified Bradyrhizobium]|uniref:caspase family protein n=1 Tax=unclassified Bradyrhizobium TaxID=2631580 RepID=UPI0028E41BEF|nr:MULTISPECIES: caspase family protein [unclassified Bradyrhizobium]
MRKALVVGIDYYKHITGLSGCVNDAHAVKAMLDRHADGSVNFGTLSLTCSGEDSLLTKRILRNAVQELFAGDSDIALFYFAGHGYIEETGGYLCAADCESGEDGLPLNDLMVFANSSRAKNKVIVLDSCHSGIVAQREDGKGLAEIKEGMTILTASTADQYAKEVPGGGAGVFTNLFIDALGGAAANLVGEVTPGGVYAHIDQSLGPWAQRPVFKTNVRTFVSLRKVTPPLELADLQRIAEFFPAPGYELKLDPSFEPERTKEQANDQTIPPPDPRNTAIFKILQRYNRVNLLVPNNAPHMWHAAMERKSCSLTALGEHYRRLVANGLI